MRNTITQILNIGNDIFINSERFEHGYFFFMTLKILRP